MAQLWKSALLFEKSRGQLVVVAVKPQRGAGDQY
jgi:hypothetical protein